MTWKMSLLLAGLGLVAAMFVAAFQPTPGYMDADYYYAGGRTLATGHGFTDMVLWNYLDNPTGLPHPSNAYWMPLASLLAAAGAVLFGPSSWIAARVGFLAVAAALPPLTAALAWSISARRDLAITSGLLAVFPAFYLPFLPVTDTFGLYMLLGGLFFLLLSRSLVNTTHRAWLISAFLLGIISGLMHLSRADGIRWFILAIIAVLYFRKPDQSRISILYSLGCVLLGYLLVMGPWFARNISAFGTLLAPGGTKMLWLSSYDQLFAFPASQLTFASWWHSGLAAILEARVMSLGLNLATTLSVQAEVFLLPLIALGFWYMRKDKRIQLATLAWLLTLGAMTVIFPFAGARGGFFHSGAALQTVWWVLAPVGLERVMQWGSRKRGWNAPQARTVFQIGLIGLAVLLTAVIIWTRVIGGNSSFAINQSSGQGWGLENDAYSHINKYLVTQGAATTDTIMVADPPGFFLASGNPSIAVPDGNVNTVLAAARKYHAVYLVLEEGSVPTGLLPVYENPGDQMSLTYLGEIEHARIFRIRDQ
ncbi:MAG: hypothetical protein ABSA23_06650 [Anaerolineales bacterium]